MKRNLAILIILSLMVQLCFCTPVLAVSASEDVSVSDGIISDSAYEKYVLENGGIKRASVPEISVLGTDEAVLSVNETKAWSINALESGWYLLSFEYANTFSVSTEPHMQISIDGKAPFSDAEDISLPLYYNTGEIKTNDDGDEIRPSYTLNTEYHNYSFSDSEELYPYPYELYLEKGMHSIELTLTEGKLSIKNLILSGYEELLSYEDYKKNYSEYKGEPKQFEAESFVLTNSISVTTASNVTSHLNTPLDIFNTKLNVLGGANWKYAGDSVLWNIEAPEDGLYSIAFRYKQNFQEGLTSFRRLTVNGEVPFKEANAIAFDYSNSWEYSKTNFKIFLKKGMNTLELKSTVGDVAPVLSMVDDLIVELNSLYRRIMMITGSSPDSYRDYDLVNEIPNLKETLSALAEKTDKAVEAALKIIDGSGQVYVLRDISRQLKSMSEDIRSITKSGRLDSFKSNVSSLSAFSMKLREHPLLLDSFTIYADEIEFSKESLFGTLKHNFLRFLATFSEDYIKSGNSDDSLTVWINNGRDQMQILKDLIDNDFTGNNGIDVNLQLVTGSLLHAVLAGKGPDIALERTESEVINFAMRDAAEDISKYDGFEETLKRFSSSATLPYTYNDGVYGLPQTQSFEMMFVRTDVLAELGVEIPKTWGELTKNVLPVLQRNNLTVGVGNLNNGGALNCIYTLLLTQHGGSLYTEDLLSADLTSPEGLDSFEFAVSMFRDYGVPQEYDFINRFRTGEIPIALASYSSYNQLQISAPEISGLWQMFEIPGIENEDGSVNNSQLMTGTGAMLLASSKNKENGWKFIKWLTSADTQRSYGLQLEAVLGASGRYTTANIEAMSGLMWNSAQLKVLENQRSSSLSMTNIPGSYYVGKALNSAIVVSVTEDGIISREELTRWDELIDEEITRKAKEFNYKGKEAK